MDTYICIRFFIFKALVCPCLHLSLLSGHHRNVPYILYFFFEYFDTRLSSIAFAQVWKWVTFMYFARSLDRKLYAPSMYICVSRSLDRKLCAPSMYVFHCNTNQYYLQIVTPYSSCTSALKAVLASVRRWVTLAYSARSLNSCNAYNTRPHSSSIVSE